MSVYEKLTSLGITLKAPAAPVAAYVMYVQTGNLVFLSGHNKVKRIVKVMSLVNSTPDYTDQHLVTNGCSELLGEVFGDAGKHARSAFGVAQVPRGACVEIEMIVEVA